MTSTLCHSEEHRDEGIPTMKLMLSLHHRDSHPSGTMSPRLTTLRMTFMKQISSREIKTGDE